MKQKSAYSRERGLYLVLVALAIGVVAVLVAYFLNTARLTQVKAKTQDVTNLAALGCLEAFTSSNGTAYYDRAQACLNRARNILESNSFPGVKNEDGHIFEVTFDQCPHNPVDRDCDANQGKVAIRLGTYYPSAPSSSGIDCHDTYPCFVPNELPISTSTESANAVQVFTTNRSEHQVNQGQAFESPADFFGAASDFSAVGSATVVPKCTAYLIDLSTSVSGTTHLPWIEGPRIPETSVTDENDPNFTWFPRPPVGYRPALMSFTPDVVEHTADCNTPVTRGNLASFWSMEKRYWCNMAPVRPEFPNPEDHDPTHHYRDDYQPVRDTPFGLMYVDLHRDSVSGYEGAEPFTSFFHAFNAGTRAISALSTSADEVVIIPFAGKLRFPYPQTGTTNDVAYLARLTNLNHVDDANDKPNYLNFGWFSLLRRQYQNEDSSTNLGMALLEAVSRLRSCPSSFSRKNIVLATDSLPSCFHASDASPPTPEVPAYENYLYTCGNDYQFLRNFANRVEDGGLRNNLWDTVLPELKRAGIAVTVLLAGDYVRPNFTNISNGRGGFLNQEEARILGYGNHPTISSTAWWVNENSRFIGGTDENNSFGTNLRAFADVPAAGAFLGRGPQIAAQIGFETAGGVCPLMPLCDPTVTDDLNLSKPNNAAGCNNGDFETEGCPNPCYKRPRRDPNDASSPPDMSRPCELLNSARIARNPGYPPSRNNTQTCSLLALTKAEQAADCVKRSLSQNPYILLPNDVPLGIKTS